MTIPEIASAALAILDDCGWTQGVCKDEQGRICMGSALCRASGLPEDGKLTSDQLTTWVAVTDAVLRAQQEVLPGPFDATNVVPKLNDYSTEEDVRAVLGKMRE